MKRRKFYQSRLMLRAGSPHAVMRGPFTALRLQDGKATIVTQTDVCAFCRDHLGWTKEFARAVAGIDPHHLAIYQCYPEQAQEIADALSRPPRTSWLPLGFAIP